MLLAFKLYDSIFRMAGTASVAGEVFVDALPYFDQGYDAAGVREAVRKLLHYMLTSAC